MVINNAVTSNKLINMKYYKIKFYVNDLYKKY